MCGSYSDSTALEFYRTPEIYTACTKRSQAPIQQKHPIGLLVPTLHIAPQPWATTRFTYHININTTWHKPAVDMLAAGRKPAIVAQEWDFGTPRGSHGVVGYAHLVIHILYPNSRQRCNHHVRNMNAVGGRFGVGETTQAPGSYEQPDESSASRCRVRYATDARRVRWSPGNHACCVVTNIRDTNLNKDDTTVQVN